MTITIKVDIKKLGYGYSDDEWCRFLSDVINGAVDTKLFLTTLDEPELNRLYFFVDET